MRVGFDANVVCGETTELRAKKTKWYRLSPRPQPVVNDLLNGRHEVFSNMTKITNSNGTRYTLLSVICSAALQQVLYKPGYQMW